MSQINSRIISYLKALAIALPLIIAAAVTSCSPKKNNAATRNYQAFITRYNIYFNGDEHYKQTLKQMEDSYEDDFSRLIPLHPVDAKSDPTSPQPAGSFDRSIEKAQKAIQLRSIKKKPRRKAGKGNDPEYKEWLKREEYNPFLHNAWMMQARSQYMNGDFLAAATTFHYIQNHFKWLPATSTEAALWMARCYVSLGWNFEAQTILRRITPEQLTNSTLQELYSNVLADYYIHAGEFDNAIEPLIQARDKASGTQKTRLTFLLGQIYARQGKNAEAYKEFEKVAKSHSAPYRTKFNARIKQSEVYSGKNIEPEVKSLRSMLHYSRNKEFADQIYYAIGNLYLSRQDTLKAIENYSKAIEQSTRNGIDKALAQIMLGGLYFDQRDYDLAQPLYSEAMPQLPESRPDYSLLKRRSDVLDELAVYSQNVKLQDSLLRLSQMDEKQRLEIINRIIKELKKKEKEEEEAAKREEYLANQSAQGNANANRGNANNPASFSINNDKSWYFYNDAVKNAGKTEFQKRWGSRKLEDDWRRRNKASFSFSDFDEPDDEGGNDSETSSDNNQTSDEQKQSQEELEHASDPHYPEYYLNQIPATDEERQIAHDIIQEGLYNMGLILKDKLEDFPASEAEFTKLLTTYPDNIYRLDVYYNLYLMYMRLGQPEIAEKWRQLILSDFADSEQGIALRNPNYLAALASMHEQQEKIYARTYADFLDNNNYAIHQRVDSVKNEFPMTPLMPKFMFLEALTYVTENNAEKFGQTLRELLEKYPDADLSPVASSYLKQLTRGRKLNSSTGSNTRSMIWDTRLSNDTTINFNPDSIGNMFDFTTDGEHLLVLTFPNDTVSSNELLFNVARHNFSTFMVKDFPLEQMNFGNLGIITIGGFENANELSHYRRAFDAAIASGALDIPKEVRPVVISKKNFDTLLLQGSTFEQYFNAAAEAAEKAARALEQGGEEDADSTDDIENSPEEEATPASDENTPADPEEETEVEEAP